MLACPQLLQHWVHCVYASLSRRSGCLEDVACQQDRPSMAASNQQPGGVVPVTMQDPCLQPQLKDAHPLDPSLCGCMFLAASWGPSHDDDQHHLGQNKPQSATSKDGSAWLYMSCHGHLITHGGAFHQHTDSPARKFTCAQGNLITRTAGTAATCLHAPCQDDHESPSSMLDMPKSLALYKITQIVP